MIHAQQQRFFDLADQLVRSSETPGRDERAGARCSIAACWAADVAALARDDAAPVELLDRIHAQLAAHDYAPTRTNINNADAVTDQLKQVLRAVREERLEIAASASASAAAGGDFP